MNYLEMLQVLQMRRQMQEMRKRKCAIRYAQNAGILPRSPNCALSGFVTTAPVPIPSPAPDDPPPSNERNGARSVLHMCLKVGLFAGSALHAPISIQFNPACEHQLQHVGDRDAPIVSLKTHTPPRASRKTDVIASKQSGHWLVGRRHGRQSGAGL